jgi:outer membrane beta-barrel protein
MKRRMNWLWAIALVGLISAPTTALAQDDEEMTFDEDEAKKPAEGGGDDIEIEDEGGDPGAPPEGDLGELPDDPTVLGDDPGVKPIEADKSKVGDERVSWQDIVVVVRKPFLKGGRVELLPTWGTTMNDNLVRHFQFNAAINYFLTDVLAVGVEGQYYVEDLREPFDLVARQARRLPTVNKYNFGAALNFHYVPIYGKFAVLDEHIIHWETYFTAGVGFTQSEVIPRDPALQSFKNFLITPNVGGSLRFFIFKWMTVNVGIRDYIFVDRFEDPMRTEVSGDAAKDNADSKLINNVVFQAGVSFWLPPTFEYTTFR